MAVPDFQSLTLPVLKEFADGVEHATKDIRQRVAEQIALTKEDLSEVLPSGTQTRFANRVAWAHVYMKRAGLLTSPRRGIYKITARGESVLQSPPARIDIDFLNQYPEMAGFRTPTVSSQVKSASPALLRIMTEGLSATMDSRALTPDE
jgi:restriction system protein